MQKIAEIIHQKEWEIETKKIAESNAEGFWKQDQTKVLDLTTLDPLSFAFYGSSTSAERKNRQIDPPTWWRNKNATIVILARSTFLLPRISSRNRAEECFSSLARRYHIVDQRARSFSPRKRFSLNIPTPPPPFKNSPDPNKATHCNLV